MCTYVRMSERSSTLRVQQATEMIDAEQASGTQNFANLFSFEICDPQVAIIFHSQNRSQN